MIFSTGSTTNRYTFHNTKTYNKILKNDKASKYSPFY